MSKYLDIIQPAIDSFGLIAQLPSDNRDGGDTTHREGIFALSSAWLLAKGQMTPEEYAKIKIRYMSVLSELECCPGNLKRHTDPSMWYSDCDRMSRDQWTPNVIAMGMMGLKSNLWRMFWGHCNRALLFTTNTRRNWTYPPGHPKHDATQDYSWKLPDFTVLSAWGYYIRAFKAWPLYPLLLITDLDLFINSLIWLYNFKYDPSNNDISNHVNGLVQAKWTMGTPISWLARKILNVTKVQETLDAYFTPDAAPLHLVFKDFLSLIW